MNINVVRSVRAFGMRSTVGLMFALMLFAFMLRLSDDQAGMQNRIGLLFQIVNCPTYSVITNAVDLCKFMFNSNKCFKFIVCNNIIDAKIVVFIA